MLNQFDKINCCVVQHEMITALQNLCTEYGLNVRYEGGKFSDLEFTVKLKLTIRETANGESVEALRFAEICEQYQVPASAYGQVIEIQGKRLKLVGFELKRSKYCVKVLDLNTNKAMLYPEAVLKSIQTTVAQ